VLAPALLGAAAVAAAWGWWEAGWVRLRTIRVPIPGLPRELEGLRVAHLSDFHLGTPSRGTVAVERAVDWVVERRPDLVCLTGDLLSHPRGKERLDGLAARLPGAFAVLGNHDFGVARDPFARRSAPYGLPGVLLLADAGRTVDVRGLRVQVVGVDPNTYLSRGTRPEQLADPDARLRILLSHYPRQVDRLEPGVFDLVLAGHLHDGQIAVPYPGGKVRLAHLDFPYPSGLYHRPAAALHVSPGLGTTFVPFRFAARPEATELLLQSA
jgi:predicted MPP superfamily phosphohydrolase